MKTKNHHIHNSTNISKSALHISLFLSTKEQNRAIIVKSKKGTAQSMYKRY